MKTGIMYSIFIVLITLCHASKALSAPADPNEKRHTLPSSVRELVEGPWKADSFDKSVTLLKDKKQSVESREALLAKLNSKRRHLKRNEQEQLIRDSIAIAKDPNEPSRLSAISIRVMAGMSLIMLEKGEITRTKAISEKQFLMETARDNKRDPLLRASAIKAIDTLKIAEATPLLKDLLDDPNNLNSPEITRGGCLALMRLEGKNSFGHINRILAQTSEPSIFGTAAYCLGHIKTPQAMVALMQNDKRFPDTGAADFTLVDMAEVIYEVLATPDDSNLSFAIQATRHLWSDGQRGKYMPLLHQLLTTAPLPERIIATERLLEEAMLLPFEKEKKELSKVLTKIENQPDLNKYTVKIKERMSAKLLTPETSDIGDPTDQ